MLLNFVCLQGLSNTVFYAQTIVKTAVPHCHTPNTVISEKNAYFCFSIFNQPFKDFFLFFFFTATGVNPILLLYAINFLGRTDCFKLHVLSNCFHSVPTTSTLRLETLPCAYLILCTKMKLCLCRSVRVILLCFARQFNSRAVCQVYYIITLY
mgnify:CR=1 FL=1